MYVFKIYILRSVNDDRISKLRSEYRRSFTLFQRCNVSCPAMQSVLAIRQRQALKMLSSWKNILILIRSFVSLKRNVATRKLCENYLWFAISWR
jgi:hypothetical protein